MAKQKTKFKGQQSQPNSDVTQLPQKAALVLFTSSQCAFRVIDKNATRKVLDDNSADADAGRFNKHLLPGNKTVKEIQQNIAAFRQGYLYEVTLPWGDDGWRLIPAKRISEFKAKFRKHRDAHEELVIKLLAEYEEAKQKAKRSLGKLYREDEYPTVDALREKYRFESDWNSISDAADLRVEVSGDVAAEIQKEITEKTQAKLHRAVEDTYTRVHQTVSKLVERLTDDEKGESKIFRDSLVSNIRDLADVLPSLNITDDPKLAQVAEDLHNKLGKLDPEALRTDEAEKKAAVKTAQEILAELSGAI